MHKRRRQETLSDGYRDVEIDSDSNQRTLRLSIYVACIHVALTAEGNLAKAAWQKFSLVDGEATKDTSPFRVLETSNEVDGRSRVLSHL